MTDTGTILPLRDSFLRSKDAEGRSPLTMKSYGKAIDQLDRYLATRDHSRRAEDVTRADIEGFLLDGRERGLAPATSAQHFRSLQQFFRWLAEEEEIAASPMARMRPPAVPEAPPPILTREQIEAMLATCRGNGFAERRDAAIIAMLADTGIRRAECAGLRVRDIDFRSRTAVVTGKGNRTRGVAFGRRAAQLLDRYIRARARHTHRDSEWLWLGKRGRYTETGISETVRDRAEQAGLGPVNPHRLRHSFAHAWLSAGGQEGDLMLLAGWRSRSMLSRYGASAAGDRARRAHGRLSPLDQDH